MLKNLALGKAGELRVASELLLRGYEVSMSLVDSGSDLILTNGTRIQVKASRKIAYKSRQELYNYYAFAFKSWKKKENHHEAHNLEDVDYIILWAVDDDIFYVIPAEEIRGRYSVKLTPNNHSSHKSHFAIFKEQWQLLKNR